MTRTEQLEAPKETFGDTSSSTPTRSIDDHPRARLGVGTVVVLTLGGAIVLALLLIAVVFAGATEGVITAATLLSFALGWAGLWWLSRRTDHPQPWAAAPAAFLAVGACLTLLFGTEGSNFGWLWPPALLVLVAWMAPRVRRQLPGRTRGWVVYPLFVVMVAAAVGGADETFAEYRQPPSASAHGRLVDVGGHRLHLDCAGTGGPVVVLEAGLGQGGTEAGAWITPTVSSSTRICTYDRAGRGASDSVGHAQTSDEVVADLHRLLARSGETGPFVFAGHSAGGLYVLNYAHRYPSEVAGVVLLDSMHPDQATRITSWITVYGGMRRGTAILPSLARLGLARAFMQSSYGDLPPATRDELRAVGSTPKQARSLRDETSQLLATLDAAKGLQTLGDTPLVVVTAGKGAMGGWAAAQDDLADLSTNSAHVVVASATHADLIEDREAAGNSTKAVLDVVAAVRSNGSVASR